jgi:hypothetical protein
VSDAEGGDRTGFIFGAGLVANFFDVYYASSWKGYEGAARIVGEVFLGSFTGGELARRVLAATPCELRVDGESQPPETFSLIAASVIRDLGLHMLVTYRADDGGEDRFHAIASALQPSALGPQMPRVLLGRRLAGEHHVDTMAKELHLRFTSERAVYNLDGEPLRAREVTVRRGPEIRVLALR